MPDAETTEKLANALRVLVWTSETRAWLRENDPQALRQAVEALEELPSECLFPNSHNPAHPSNMKFHVAFGYQRGWEDLTEQEIVDRLKEVHGDTWEQRGFTCGSQWYFWWEG